MKERQGKFRRILRLRVILVLNVVLLFFVVVSFGREYVRNYEIDKEIKNLEAEAQKLESENENILSLVNRLQTADYLEEEARLKLGLKKPGEQVVVIPEPEMDAAAGQEIVLAANEEKEPSNPRLWWNYFFQQQ